MPKVIHNVEAYQCSFCTKRSFKQAQITIHEKSCKNNPFARICERCVNVENTSGVFVCSLTKKTMMRHQTCDKFRATGGTNDESKSY